MNTRQLLNYISIIDNQYLTKMPKLFKEEGTGTEKYADFYTPHVNMYTHSPSSHDTYTKTNYLDK